MITKVFAYQRIANELRSEILQSDRRIFSESMLIQRFGVSSVTARRALNELEDAGLVVRKVGKGSVVRRPADKAIKEFGAVFFDMFSARDAFVADIMQGLDAAAKTGAAHLHAYTTRERGIAASLESSLHHLVVKRRIDGLFLLSPLPPDDVRFLAASHIPCVTLANRYPGLPVPAVTLDFTEAMLTVGRRFVAQGRRRIGLVTLPDAPPDIERSRTFLLRAYRAMIERLGLPFDPDLVRREALSDSGGRDGLQALWELPPDRRPQGIVIGSVAQSPGAAAWLREHPEWTPAAVYMAERPGLFLDYLSVACYELGRLAHDVLQRAVAAPATPPPSVAWPATLCSP